MGSVGGPGGRRPAAGRSSEIAMLEADAVVAGLFNPDLVPGGSGEVSLDDPDDPRHGMNLPVPPPTVEEFYQELGCPFEDSKTGDSITELAPYQLRTCENLRRHRKLLILKSQKIGLSSLGIVATLHEALTRCQGYEIIILAQSSDKVVEHGRDMVKFLENSRYSEYIIAKQAQVPGAVKNEVCSQYHIYLQNRDLTSVRSTHIYLLYPTSRQIASLKRVKYIWASDITIVDDTVKRQESVFMALLSRLILTEGNVFIECPTVGHLGPDLRTRPKVYGPRKGRHCQQGDGRDTAPGPDRAGRRRPHVLCRPHPRAGGRRRRRHGRQRRCRPPARARPHVLGVL